MIQEIELDKLKIHPKNVRKTYNNIDELADSIKAQGILQNLTVVPDPEDKGTYLVVIGNRRLTAAREAGIKTAPCYISDMDEKEQVSMMLLENMQRNDLTIYEQAQGFQMVLDLGETKDGLSEKTGLSKTTINRRLNIAKLDQKVLAEKEQDGNFQLQLKDLYELEKIDDLKIRDKVLKESTDSRDLARRTINAVNDQIRNKNYKLFVDKLKPLGIIKAPRAVEGDFYSNKWERMINYDLNMEPPKNIKFKDNGEQIYYLERYGRLYLVRKAKKEKKELTQEEKEKKQHDKDKRQLKDIMKEAANSRREFIEGIISGRIDAIKETKEIEEELFEQILSWESFVGHNKLKEFFLGCELYNAKIEDIKVAEKKMNGLSMLHKLLCITSAMVANADLMEWNYRYNKNRGEKVMKFYTVLEKYGYTFSNDEEKEAIDGSSNLYVK